MLRATFSILALSLLSHNLQAQFIKSIIPKLSIQVEAGYGRSLPVEYLYEIRESREGIDLIGKNFDLAGGLQLGLGLGYDLNSKFRIVLQGQYQESPKLNLSNIRKRSTGWDTPPVFRMEPQSFSFKTLSISSLVQYNLADLGKTWQAFFNFGPSLYIQAQVKSGVTFFNTTTVSESIKDMRMNAGLTSSIGLEKKLGSKLSASMAFQIRASYFNKHPERRVGKGAGFRRGLLYLAGGMQSINNSMNGYDHDYYGLYPILPYTGEDNTTGESLATKMFNETTDRSLNYFATNILLGLTYHF